MTIILQLTRRLDARPIAATPRHVTLRHYAGEPDIAVWLSLRRQAFARQKLGVRDWDVDDFTREFLTKPWWQPERMWLAEWHNLDEPAIPIGSVTCGQRGDKPVVHWLVVLPAYRRHGVGRLLLATLESCAWDAGHRQVWLETHSQWTEAVALYRSLGYEQAD